MSDLIPFDFNEHPVRLLDLDGQPWFVAKDVALALEYRDADKLVRWLDEDEADTHIVGIRSDNGVVQNREVTTINESGLYHAILKSRKPAAKAFRKWVTTEVLPTLRKTGVYGTIDPADRLAISRQVVSVTNNLVKNRNGLAREVYYKELQDLYTLLGHPVPDKSLLDTRIASPLEREMMGGGHGY